MTTRQPPADSTPHLSDTFSTASCSGRLHDDFVSNAQHLAGVDVRAPAVDVRVVREEDVLRRARELRDSRARVPRDDDVRNLTVLAGDAETERLREERSLLVLGKTQELRDSTSPSARLSHAASILSAFTVASWYLNITACAVSNLSIGKENTTHVETFSLAEMPSQVSPRTTV